MSLVDLFAEKSEAEIVRGQMFGVVIGIVSNVDDPDGLGRVKVQYPWLKDESESPWARVVSFMAGPNQGAVFRPAVGTEVLVAFEHGDMRIPYVIGALWNGRDGMPEERGADGDNAVRLIKTASGHQVVLDDTAGAEKVTIVDKAGNRIELSSSGVVIESDAIKLGSAGASESLVLGTAFMSLFNAHTHPTGVGPSGPPTPPRMAEGVHVSRSHRAE